jgi:hypothetical protein
LTLGHTDPEEMDERKQPVPVGYAINYRVRYATDLKKHMLTADYYIRRDKFELAKTFPRTSIELWPDEGKEIIDPIALLRRTPQRDLGQWIYSRGKHVLRYSMEHQMAEDYELPEDDMGSEDVDLPPVESPEGDATHEEKVEQFMRHCFSHPHAKYLSGHYGMPDEMMGDDMMEDAPAEGDPTDFPDSEEPLQNAAAASATNGAPPGGDLFGDEPDGDEGMPPPASQYRRDQIAVKYSKLRRQVIAYQRKAREAEARRIVGQLTAEGYQLDAAVEVPRLMRMNQKQRETHESHIRRYYRQAPVGKTGRVPTQPTVESYSRAGNLSSAHYARALNYARENPGAAWNDAVQKTK